MNPDEVLTAVRYNLYRLARWPEELTHGSTRSIQAWAADMVDGIDKATKEKDYDAITSMAESTTVILSGLTR